MLKSKAEVVEAENGSGGIITPVIGCRLARATFELQPLLQHSALSIQHCLSFSIQHSALPLPCWPAPAACAATSPTPGSRGCRSESRAAGARCLRRWRAWAARSSSAAGRSTRRSGCRRTRRPRGRPGSGVPRRRAAPITPIAISSLKQKIAVGRSRTLQQGIGGFGAGTDREIALHDDEVLLAARERAAARRRRADRG